MGRMAKINRMLYMLDEFQRDVARQAKAKGLDDAETIDCSVLTISAAAVGAMMHRDEVENLVKDIAEMLWQVAHIAECAGVQMSDLAGYAVDQHDGRTNRRVM